MELFAWLLMEDPLNIMEDECFLQIVQPILATFSLRLNNYNIYDTVYSQQNSHICFGCSWVTRWTYCCQFEKSDITSDNDANRVKAVELADEETRKIVLDHDGDDNADDKAIELANVILDMV